MPQNGLKLFFLHVGLLAYYLSSLPLDLKAHEIRDVLFCLPLHPPKAGEEVDM